MLGAYARLVAWTSLRGLLDIDAEVEPERVQQDADATTWTQFSAKSYWFYQVAWDIGLVAFRPDTHSLNVLAATDTDYASMLSGGSSSKNVAPPRVGAQCVSANNLLQPGAQEDVWHTKPPNGRPFNDVAFDEPLDGRLDTGGCAQSVPTAKSLTEDLRSTLT